MALMENLHHEPKPEPGREACVRIRFEIEQDEDGYPGVGTETVWARRGARGFEVDNIPFYVRGVSCGDVVSVEPPQSGIFEFREVIEPSFHSTIRVVLAKECSDRRPVEERMDELRQRLSAIGCDSEGVRPGFFSVDIPPSTTLSAVRKILVPGFEDGLWDYEEATLWHKK